MRLLPFIIMLLLVTSGEVHAQKKAKALTNLGKFDTRTYHFGVQLSYNNADFYLTKQFDPFFSDSLKTLQHLSSPGFNIAIITELHLNKNVGIRFIPGISPRERLLSYTFINRQGNEDEFIKSVRSFYIDFPLLLKYRTDRIKNFAAYVIAGGQFSRDMASQDKVNNNQSGEDQTIIKIQRNDYLISAGGGFDFFLPYFKFGIEMKMNYGLGNLLIQDMTRFSEPIQSLRSKNFILSFTFEG